MELLIKEIKKHEDMLLPIEGKLLNQDQKITYEDILEFKLKLEDINTLYYPERLKKIDQELFIRKINILQEVWEEGG